MKKETKKNTIKETAKPKIEEGGWASDDSWVSIIFMLLMFGFRNKNPELEFLENRISRLEAKNEIIEKLVTK